MYYFNKATIRERALEFLRNMRETHDGPGRVTFYTPAGIRRLGMLDDLKVVSLSNELHRMSEDGLIQVVMLRYSDYPPACRYAYAITETCET